MSTLPPPDRPHPPESDPQIAKARVRQRLAALGPPDSWTRAAVVDRVSEWLAQREPALVVGFLAMDEEIDMAPLVRRHPDVRFALTRTAPGRSLTLHPFETPREIHAFGFEQPAAGTDTLDASDVDVVLVPGVAFTRSGHRLGRGAGYYDRFLPSVSADLLALTTEERIVDDLPVEPHDIPVDWIATERGVTPVS